MKKLYYSVGVFFKIYRHSSAQFCFSSNLLFLLICSVSIPTWSISITCEEALQLRPIIDYLASAQNKVAGELSNSPHPNFINPNKDAAIKRTGYDLPATLKAFVGIQEGIEVSALKTPSLNTEHPAVAARFIPITGVSAHLEIQSDGQEFTTQAYFNMPILTSEQQLTDTQFLFSPQKGHKLIIYHGHGGGTPMAEAMNASSLAQYTVKHGLPLLAVDQHGHGKGPNTPLLSYDDKIEYNLRILEKTVHPEVLIILSGHSWGGEDLMYFWTQYYPKHKDGRFKQILRQIVGVMPLSPPTDLAMGNGSARQRVEIEESLFRGMANDPIFATRIAEKDREFLINILRSGKSSLNALWKTILTQIYLNLPLPDSEAMKELPFIRIYMGKRDGLVYVGREFAFQPWQDLLKENFVLLDVNNTQREKNVKQGHQTFDALDEKGRPIVYHGMIEVAEKLTRQSFPEINFEARGNHELLPNLHRIFIQYMSFFAAKEYFDQRKVFVVQDTEQGIQTVKMRRILEEFTRGLAQLREESQKEYTQELNSRMNLLARQYDIRGGDEEGAHKELDMEEPTSSRRKHLDSFINEAAAIERDMFRHRNFESDEEVQEKIRKFTTKVEAEYKTRYEARKRQLKPEETLSDYEPLEQTVVQIMNLEEGRALLKGLFANREKVDNFDVAYDEILTRYQLQEFSQIDESHILSKLEDAVRRVRNAFNGPRDFKKERNGKIESIIQFRKAEKREYNQATHALVLKAVSQINPSLGVNSIKEARWEVENDYSQERREKVHEFLVKMKDTRRELRAQINNATEQKIKTYLATHLPNLNQKMSILETEESFVPFVDESDVHRKVMEMHEIESQHFIPQGESSEAQHLRSIVTEMKDLEHTQEALRVERENFLKEYDLKDLLKYKNTLLRKIEDLFEESHIGDGPDKWPNGEMPRWWSKKVREEVGKRERTLERWKKVEERVAKEIHEYLLTKFEQQGRFIERDFTDIPLSIREKMELYRVLRDKFFKTKQAVFTAFFTALRRGNLLAKNYPVDEEIPNVAKASEHLNTLIGETDLADNPLLFDTASIEGKLRFAEEKLYEFASKDASLKAQINLLKYEYNQVAQSVDPRLIVKEYVIVDIGELLNKGMDEVLSLAKDPRGEIITKATHIALKDWEDLWKELLHEIQIANPEWYPLNPQYYRAASGDVN